jgi:glyoxylase-like metal-dependent hydrolase (beta-lactamase superfamily II)
MFRNLEQLSPRVFVFPRDETPNAIQPNIGLIKLARQSILIDAGNSPRHARQISAAMTGQDFAPIETIILTHHHWDHSFGAASFNALHLIAHQDCAKALADYAKREWSASALREEIIANPKREVSNNAMIDAIADWRDFHIPEVSLSFTRSLTLYFEDLTIELEHVGGRHSADSIVVRIPEEEVMFLGDCYYPPPKYLRSEGDEDLDLSMLESFYRQDYHFYVDGHGSPGRREALAKMIAWEKGRQGIRE